MYGIRHISPKIENLHFQLQFVPEIAPARNMWAKIENRYYKLQKLQTPFKSQAF